MPTGHSYEAEMAQNQLQKTYVGKDRYPMLLCVFDVSCNIRSAIEAPNSIEGYLKIFKYEFKAVGFTETWLQGGNSLNG